MYMNELLMSIKTKYVNEIFKGNKIYEFRKKSIGDKNLIKKIYIYSSEKDRAIVGYIIVDRVLEGNLDYILKETNTIDNLDIINYFKNTKKCYALHILKYYKFKTNISLEELRKNNKKFIVPEYFRYLKKDEEYIKTHK